MESRTKKVTHNLIWGMISRIISLLLPFATRTVVIYTLGITYVGLGSLFTSILQVLSLAELGIGSALVFSMYRPIAEENDAMVNALLNLYRKCYRIIGLVVLVLGMAIIPFLNYLVAGDIPSDVNIQILFIAYLFNNLISYFVYGYKQSIFIASQRIDYVSKIELSLKTMTSIAQIVLLLLFKNYYSYVVAIPIMTLLNNLLIGWIANMYYPQYRPSGEISKDEIKDISKRVVGLVFQKIGNIVLSSVDTIVISAFLGLRVLGIYNGYFYVITTLFGFLGVVYTSLVPTIGNLTISKSKEHNYTVFKMFHFIYLWIVMWWSACLLCLYQPFIELWQGKDNMLTFDIVIALVVYFFVHKMGDMSGIFKEALGLWWENKSVPFISSIVNLALNIYLVQRIGLMGVVTSTIVAVAFIFVPFGGVVLFDKYFNDRKKFARYLSMIVVCFISAAVASGITYYVCSFITDVSIMALLIKGLICLVVPNIVLVIIHFKNPDFRLAYNYVKSNILPSIRRRLAKG